MRVPMSESLQDSLWRVWIDSTVQFRYHVGRHVANLQVTNTYEGTNLATTLCLDVTKTLFHF